MAAVLKEEDFVEARIARIESDVAHIQTDISDLKSDVRELKKEMKETNEKIGGLRADMNKELGALRGEMLTMGATLGGKIDKGVLQTRLWVAMGALCFLVQLLSHAFHWLGF